MGGGGGGGVQRNLIVHLTHFPVTGSPEGILVKIEVSIHY